MIRFTETADLPAICKIRRQVHKVHADGRPDVFRMPTSPEEIKEFDQMLSTAFSQETVSLIVCEANQVIVGYALIRRATRHASCAMQETYHYFIDEFGIDESMRRRGFGAKLMHGILDLANADRAAAVSLNVWDFNASAEQFYRSLGMTTQRTDLELRL